MPKRDATRVEHKKLIFDHLNFSKFKNSKRIFHEWLNKKMEKGIITCEQIYSDAEDFLIKNRICLPTTYHLRREINTFCFQKQQELFLKVYKRLPSGFIHELELILEVEEDKRISWLQELKEYPGSATISLLQEYLNHYKKLLDLNIESLDLSLISKEFSRYLYRLGRYYNVWQIKRLPTAKRYTLLTIFLNESQKIILDYIIQMHDQYISNICRECKNKHELSLKKYKRRNERAIETIECFIDYILRQDNEKPIFLNDIYENTASQEHLQQARDDMQHYKITSQFGYAHLLQNRYSSMRRYFSDFVKLPFKREKGSQSIIDAIKIIRQLDDDKASLLPEKTPIEFIDRKLFGALYTQDGKIKRSLWEIGVAIAIKEGFRSGDLFLFHSNKHVSFWNLIYNEEQWEKEKLQAYKKLHVEPNVVV